MLKRFTKSEKGQAMVEFALITPLLILLLCGIIDFGWIYGNQLLLNNASRDTARYMAINYNDTSKTGTSEANKDAAARATFIDRIGASSYMSNSDLTVDSTLVAGTENRVKITASYPLPILTPLLSTILNKSEMLINAETIMRLE